MAVAELRDGVAVHVVVVTPFPHEVAGGRLFELAVGTLARGEHLVLQGKIPAHRPAVLLAAPVAGERRLGKGHEEGLVGFARQHAVAEIERGDVGLGAFRQAMGGTPRCQLLGRRVVAGRSHGAKLSCRKPGGEFLVGLGDGGRVLEALERLEEGPVAGGHVLPPGVGKGARGRGIFGVGLRLGGRRDGNCLARGLTTRLTGGRRGGACRGGAAGRLDGRGAGFCVRRPYEARHRPETIAQHGSPHRAF